MTGRPARGTNFYFDDLDLNLSALAWDPLAMEELRRRNLCRSEDAADNVEAALRTWWKDWALHDKLTPNAAGQVGELLGLLEHLWDACEISPCWMNQTGVVEAEWNRVRELALEFLPVYVDPNSPSRWRRAKRTI